MVRYTKCSINFIILKRFLLEASEELQFGRQSLLKVSWGPLCLSALSPLILCIPCLFLLSCFLDLLLFFFFGGELFCIACWEMRHGREIFFPKVLSENIFILLSHLIDTGLAVEFQLKAIFPGNFENIPPFELSVLLLQSPSHSGYWSFVWKHVSL